MGVSLTDAVQTGDSRTPRLLPTPHAGLGEHRRDNGQDPAKRRPAGRQVSLADVARYETDVRLLPTPQAADGDGGRMERGAMGNAGVRPSGHKATLPLPTAVSMRDELTETPFARPDEDGQLDLLASDDLGLAPCGCPWDDNVDAGGYCACCGAHLDDPDGMYALQIHPKHFLRRCPLYGLPVGGLLPTPTPAARDAKGPHTPDREGGASLGEVALLPTATAADGDRTSEQFSRHYSEGADNPTLRGAAARAEVEWGVYGAAVRRWELVSGQPAPAPTDEKGRLAPAFVEWMLGYPQGWFDVEGVSRTRKLRALGNSVQVQAAEAVGGWLAFLVDSGLLT